MFILGTITGLVLATAIIAAFLYGKGILKSTLTDLGLIKKVVAPVAPVATTVTTKK